MQSSLRVLAIGILAAAIFVALAGACLIWFSMVGLIAAAIMVSRPARRYAQRWARPPIGAFQRRAVGYPGF